MKKGFNISRWAIEQPVLTMYFFVVLLLAGIASYFQLGQDEDPPFVFRGMMIRTFWPGATAMQMSDQVADKIEKTLQEVPYVDRIRTYSKPGESTTLLQLRDNAPPKEIPHIWYTVRKKIGDMRYTLPNGVQGPAFNDEFGDVFGVIYALSADGFSYAELRDYADKARQALLKVPDVAKVELYGVQDEKIIIEISQKKLALMGLDLNRVVAEIGQQNAVSYAGELHTSGDNIQVRVSGQFSGIEELRSLPLRVDSKSFHLGDIAKIYRGYVDPPAPKVRSDGHDIIALGISMAHGGDIIKLGNNLAVAAQHLRRSFPAGIELSQIQDQPHAVASSVQEFLKVLTEALVIVLLVSFLSLGLQSKPWRVDIRPGLVVALAIPSVLAVTFLVMERTHVDLHKISLGSLIIALGLLVDDAIIVVEMMVRKLEEGFDRLTATTAAYELTAIPMLTGTLITATGFLPIGMANSAVGEYTFAIFAVTTAALVISWVVSVYFVPYLGFKLLKVNKQHPGELFDSAFYQRFRRIVEWCVENRWKTIGATLFAMALGIIGMGKVEKQFFPDSSRPEILVDLWLPEGSSIQVTEDTAKRFESLLQKLPEVKSYSDFIGSGAPRFYLSIDQQMPHTNLAEFIVLPKDLENREKLRTLLPSLLNEKLPEARARVKLLPNGPPVPYPVQFRVVGDDPSILRTVADEIKTLMRANSHLKGVNDNWNESVKVLRLEMDQDRARALGVSSQSVANAGHAILSGLPIGQYREGDKLIDIELRQPEDERNTLTALASAYLPTASGKSIPISQVARVVVAWEPGIVWREGRNYAITVQGDISGDVQPATVSAEIDAKLGHIRAVLPAGYRIDVAGTVEESSKGQGSIFVNVPVMLFIMFTLLMLQLRSFSRSVLVFLTGPLGLIGAAAGLLLLHRPFGFVAMLGVIALNGMIIRNSVILIDQIEQDRRQGIPAWQAIIESAVRRCRPIMLTAAAAVLAMIPLSHSVFWGPMAVAIMGGLIVATALTLLSLPAMYAAWFGVHKD